MQPDKKIRIIFFSDTHLGFDYPIRPKIEQRRRGKDFFKNYHRVLAYAVDSNADLLIHGGDLFFRSRVPRKIVDLAYGPLIDFTGSGIPILLVPGNHERSNLPPSLFLNHPNIHIFDTPMTITIRCKEVRISISGFPFVRDNIRDRFPAILEETSRSSHSADIRLLCLHQAIEGAQVGPRDYTFRRGQDVLQRVDLPTDVQAVLAGHIHRQQILWIDDRQKTNAIPVIHSGSTERTSFAEKGEKKGFFDILFGPSSDAEWRIEGLHFRELPVRPMEDLPIPSTVRTTDMKSYIQKHISSFHQDTIVRLKCDRDTPEDVRKMLTGRFLRDIFPPTMNVQFSFPWFRRRADNR